MARAELSDRGGLRGGAARRAPGVAAGGRGQHRGRRAAREPAARRPVTDPGRRAAGRHLGPRGSRWTRRCATATASSYRAACWSIPRRRGASATGATRRAARRATSASGSRSTIAWRARCVSAARCWSSRYSLFALVVATRQAHARCPALPRRSWRAGSCRRAAPRPSALRPLALALLLLGLLAARLEFGVDLGLGDGLGRRRAGRRRQPPRRSAATHQRSGFCSTLPSGMSRGGGVSLMTTWPRESLPLPLRGRGQRGHPQAEPDAEQHVQAHRALRHPGESDRCRAV